MPKSNENTTIELANAISGMVLREDVIGSRGQVLLPAGTTLSDRHIQLLAANCVERLRVQSGDAAAKQPGKSPISPEDLDSTIEKRFRDNDNDNPVIKELARICRARMEAQ